MSQVHPAPGEGAGATAAGDDGAVAVTVAPNATEGTSSSTAPAEPLSVRARAAAALESVPMQIVSMVMTLYALFMFDINAALLPVSAAACRCLPACRAALLTRAAAVDSPAPTLACRSS